MKNLFDILSWVEWGFVTRTKDRFDNWCVKSSVEKSTSINISADVKMCESHFLLSVVQKHLLSLSSTTENSDKSHINKFTIKRLFVLAKWWSICVNKSSHFVSNFLRSLSFFVAVLKSIANELVKKNENKNCLLHWRRFELVEGSIYPVFHSIDNWNPVYCSDKNRRNLAVLWDT